jgi:2-keto-4-pentenoate hydratase
VDPHTLAQSIADAYAQRTSLPAPSSRDGSFDLPRAYATEAALADLRRAAGRRTVGLKVGFANKAVWRALKLDTLVWAHMYDDTVRFAADGGATIVPKCHDIHDPLARVCLRLMTKGALLRARDARARAFTRAHSHANCR